jgi:hypothetical protein
MRLLDPMQRSFSLPRRPLTWMILAELAVLLALILYTISFIQEHRNNQGTITVQLITPTPAPGQSQPANPALPIRQPSAPKTANPGHPGGPQLNHDQAQQEGAQWSAIRALTSAAHDYLRQVVLPAVERAESRGP